VEERSVAGDRSHMCSSMREPENGTVKKTKGMCVKSQSIWNVGEGGGQGQD